ncbi:DUF7507 domain-containing protein [Agromyces atrinae]|uniref:Fimbrial isopeptide formation D2 family protein n=1 Tax=Agromyces atrinae TaxID=592376 RepID=A0A4Q2MCX4_9MICO|nr:hypothetical protein [Agromyces atrinae]NYD67855.1 fimbrial isopeptide formation D2 family protein [Agromyces atrinae]RXZ87971.1 hypothetical protein ESP50_01895 [Agromyces atrinae]
MRWGIVLLGVPALVAGLLVASAARDDVVASAAGNSIYINESFQGATLPSGWLFSGRAGTTPPSIVAPTNNNAGGGRWLQLTNDDAYGGAGSSGFALNNTVFDSNKGVVVEYDQRIYRTNNGMANNDADGAGDGLSVFLVDANISAASGTSVDTTTDEPGGFGGGLGYSSISNSSSSWCPNQQGIAGGYFGIGFDVYGNYARSDTTAVSTRPNSVSGGASQQRVPQAIGVRGSGVRHTTTGATCTQPTNQRDLNYWYGMNTDLNPTSGGYRWIGGSGTRPANTIDNNYGDGSRYRKVRISITPETNGARTLRVYMTPAVEVGKDICASGTTPCTRWVSNPATTPAYAFVYSTNLNTNSFQAALPAQFKLGFAASTGFAVNNHQIRNLLVSTEADLAVTKRINGAASATVAPGATATYTLTAQNLGPDDITTDFPATLVDGLSGLPLDPATVTWSATVAGAARVSKTGTTFATTATGTGAITSAAPLYWIAPAGTANTVTVTVSGTVLASAPRGVAIPNTARVAVNPNGGPRDNNSVNDTAIANLTVPNTPTVSIVKTGPATFASDTVGNAGYFQIVDPGADANAPGDADVPTVRAGTSVTWAFHVVNTGQLPLSSVVVTDVDEDGAAVTVACPATTLAVGASMYCRATAIVNPTGGASP